MSEQLAIHGGEPTIPEGTISLGPILPMPIGKQ